MNGTRERVDEYSVIHLPLTLLTSDSWTIVICPKHLNYNAIT